MSRQSIGKLFAKELGAPYSDDPAVLTELARNKLRKEFLQAQAGITGANFALAESGSIVLFTNEGNGRMVTTIPPLHIAVMSLEKIIPSIMDLPVFARLLPRSATGQAITSYMSIITGTRKSGEVSGADELHIVILDNGRSGILSGECREILKCIRCGACMNICPVYRVVGGHSYGSTYAGPMGIVLSALLDGIRKRYSLLDASTLCGACEEACPVKVPLVKLLSFLREERVAKGLTPPLERAAMRVFALAANWPRLFNLIQSLVYYCWPAIQAGDGPSGLMGRIPRPAKSPFRRGSFGS